jgi:hypothetical protein
VPKPPPPPRKSDLDEVERAISVLGGHHPEHERSRRETMAAAEKRAAELATELEQSARRRRRRALVIGANVAALSVAALVTWRLVSRAHGIREALTQDEAPFLGQGLEEVASNQLTGRGVLEADAPGSSCFVALTTSGRVRVQLQGRSIEGGRSVGWCGCEPGHVRVDVSGEQGAPGLALLRVDAKTIGGPLARAWVPFHPEVWGDVGGECADATLDAWIGDHKWPKPSLDAKVLDSLPGGDTLRSAGFRLVSMAAPDATFVVVEADADQCLLAIAKQGAMSLRATGGARLVERADGAMAWCASQPATTSVWPSAAAGAAVMVLSAPAPRVGGLLGTVDCARDAGYSVATSARWLAEADAAWDAAAILRASALVGVTSGPLPETPGARDTRVAALVVPHGRAAWDPPDATRACLPPPGDGTTFDESVCVFASPVALWKRVDSSGASARAPLPVWLSSLATRDEPDAIARIPELLALARQLSRMGFEPTVLEGVTELKDGVRVVGRAGEDAVVAVGLAPKRPWVFPYTDKVPWDLGDAARVVPLSPGTTVTLTTSPAPEVPVDRRRTVIFRHAVHK